MKIPKKSSIKIPKKAKIEWAPHDTADDYARFAEEFFPKILRMDYRDVLITDESSIYDFDFRLTGDGVHHRTKNVLNKIKKVYGVDVSDVKGLILVDVFKKIEDNKK